MKRLAIIPARGGSKRIPKKNIRDFCGKPIIAYILETIKKSDLFDIIHVSTDSEEIAEVVSKLGFPVDFFRPEGLADDYTPIIPVLKYVTETYTKQSKVFDQVWYIMPTAPFIEFSDLLGADKLFTASADNKSVISISIEVFSLDYFDSHFMQ